METFAHTICDTVCKMHQTQGLPWLRICCSQHFTSLAKWEKLEPNEIDFSQGFSQKVGLRQFCI